jgi:hypothetical protein
VPEFQTGREQLFFSTNENLAFYAVRLFQFQKRTLTIQLNYSGVQAALADLFTAATHSNRVANWSAMVTRSASALHVDLTKLIESTPDIERHTLTVSNANPWDPCAYIRTHCRCGGASIVRLHGTQKADDRLEPAPSVSSTSSPPDDGIPDEVSSSSAAVDQPGQGPPAGTTPTGSNVNDEFSVTATSTSERAGQTPTNSNRPEIISSTAIVSLKRNEGVLTRARHLRNQGRQKRVLTILL